MKLLRMDLIGASIILLGAGLMIVAACLAHKFLPYVAFAVVLLGAVLVARTWRDRDKQDHRENAPSPPRPPAPTAK